MAQCSVVDLVDAQQHALLVLPQVGEAFEVHGHRHFEVDLLQLRDRVGDQVMVLQRRNGQLDPRHAAHLLGPETGGVDHVFAGDRALVGDDLPAAFGRLFSFRPSVCSKIGGAALLGGLGIGMHGAGGVEIAFAVGPHAAEDAVGRHDRVQLAGLLGA
jgi:hypothetical protein